MNLMKYVKFKGNILEIDEPLKIQFDKSNIFTIYVSDKVCWWFYKKL